MNRSTMIRGMLALAVLAAPLVLPVWVDSGTRGQETIPVPSYAKDCRPSGLPPLPSSLPLDDYEKCLYAFLFERTYAKLGWAVDRAVRDTGPFILGTNYGTHPAVRIYYSPRVMYWLTGNPDDWREGKESGKAKPKEPREGPVPDGGMIVRLALT